MLLRISDGPLMSIRNLMALGATLLLAACWFLPVHNETLDGPYALSAPDDMRQMAVCLRDGDYGCTEEVNATVIAAGFNPDYIVAARRPWSLAEPGRQGGPVEYYYIVRPPHQPGEEEKRPKEVVGPLTRGEFETAKRKLNLPSFSRHFSADELGV